MQTLLAGTGRRRAAAALVLATLILGACASAPDTRHAQPKHGTDTPRERIAVTAHPMASQAAADILDRGGSVIDAAIAAQLVLGLVEPHASGPGGGTFVMLWDARERRLRAYDGLAAAPANVTASLRTDTDGTLLPSEPSQRGGRTVGVPGTVPVLALAHARHGELPWAELFAPAIRAAEEGFAMPPYLHSIVALPDAAKNHPEMNRLYFRADGTPHPVGTMIRNPEYGKAMRQLASNGPEELSSGQLAKSFVKSTSRGFRGGLMTEQDLRDYQPVEREPVCGPFLVYRVCTMSPPSFGGAVVLQVLQMVEARARGKYDFADPEFLHLYVEAGRLAQADRRKFIGDPAFVDVPTRELTDPAYLKRRAALIDPTRAANDPPAGEPLARRVAQGLEAERTLQVASLVPDPSDPVSTTSQMVFADKHGNVLSVTTTLNLNFGARLMAEGFVLNNAMTNFGPAPRAGERMANRMEPRKRPVTSMAPTIVFDDKGVPVLAGGSAGGGPIVDYIATGLIEMLANGRIPTVALSQPRITTAVPGKVQIERGSSLVGAKAALSAKGHSVEEAALASGAGFIRRTPQGWIGAADPRRDGEAR